MDGPTRPRTKGLRGKVGHGSQAGIYTNRPPVLSDLLLPVRLRGGPFRFFHSVSNRSTLINILPTPLPHFIKGSSGGA